jgi:hypothetical protein
MKKTTTRATTTTATGTSGAPRRGRGAARKPINTDAPKTTTTVGATSGVSESNTTNNSIKNPETNSSVSALKEVYQSLYSEFARLAEDARNKLAHVEALELVLVQPSSFNLTIPSLELPAGTLEVESVSANSTSPISPSAASVESASANVSEPAKPRGRRGGRPKSVPTIDSVASKPAATEAPKRRGRQPKVVAKVETETPRRRGGLKLIKPYQDNTMLDALEKALEDRKGITVSADTLVEALYGEQLKPEQFKLAKDRVTKSLSKGKIENRWDRVPDKIGCYTISMKLLEL